MRGYRQMADAGDESVVYVHYSADVDDDPFDRATWTKSNPALGSIKTIAYLEGEARQAEASPSDLPDFLAAELNLPYSGVKTNVVGVHEWRKCVRDVVPPLESPVYVSFDAGGARSFCAAVLFSPSNGRMVFMGGCPALPSLRERAKYEGCAANDYEIMLERGEIRIYGTEQTPDITAFALDVFAAVEDYEIAGFAADRYKQADVMVAINATGRMFPVEWRGVGTGGHGSEDVNAFQRLVLEKRIVAPYNLFMEMAIQKSVLRLDGNGNKALDKAAQRDRVDCMQAAVLAAGMGMRYLRQPKRKFTFFVA